MKKLAIIPARGGSKRLKNKNFLNFNGKPMFLHTYEAALKSEMFDEVHISTNSQEIVSICNDLSIPLPFLRPEKLCLDDSDLNDACRFVLNEFSTKHGKDFEYFCMLWATSPFRDAKDIRAAFDLFDRDTNAVVAVTNYQLPVFCAQYTNENGFLEMHFPDFFWRRSQEMPETLCNCGSMAWVKTEAFNKEGVWMPSKTKGYRLDPLRAFDIDDEADLTFARSMI